MYLIYKSHILIGYQTICSSSNNVDKKTIIQSKKFGFVVVQAKIPRCMPLVALEGQLLSSLVIKGPYPIYRRVLDL